jgi:hypothetical protein
MSGSTASSEPAGQRFRLAVQLGIEDAQQLHLRYHLLRLSVVGLTKKDQEELLELGRLAFQGSDVTKQVDKIKGRSSASPLAVALADIVGQATLGLGGPVDTRALMLGAVLGAYAAFADGGSSNDEQQLAAAILGAIGGAVATTTSTLVTDNVLQRAWSEYLNPAG